MEREEEKEKGGVGREGGVGGGCRRTSPAGESIPLRHPENGSTRVTVRGLQWKNLPMSGMLWQWWTRECRWASATGYTIDGTGMNELLEVQSLAVQLVALSLQANSRARRPDPMGTASTRWPQWVSTD